LRFIVLIQDLLGVINIVINRMVKSVVTFITYNGHWFNI